MFRDIERELGIDQILDADASVLSVRIDTRRYGKSVTVIEGFASDVDLREVASELKHALGTGGTSKGGRIELQGDHRKGAQDWLLQKGYHLA